MSRTYTLDGLSRLVDHTNLHADATEADMKKLCDEAREYHFKMVAINSGQSARSPFPLRSFLRTACSPMTKKSSSRKLPPR